MTILSSGTTYPLTIPAGNALVTIDLSGTSTVTGVTREDASRWHGTGAKACNPVSTATAITISTTGKVDYRLVAGDATPSSDSFRYNPVTFDSTPADSAAVAAARKVFVPLTKNRTGIYNAMIAALAVGGAVELDPVSYDLTDGGTNTTPLPVYSGLKITCPVLPQFYWGTSGFQAPDSVPQGVSVGAVLVGDGTFAAFQGNSDAVGAFASPSAFTNAGFTGMHFEGIVFNNVTSAFKIGGTNNPGAWHSKFHHLYVLNATDWGVNLENFQHIDVRHVYALGCKHGQRYSCSSSTSILSPGNSSFDHIFCVRPSTATPYQKGIMFEAYGTGAELNELNVGYIQCNGGAGITSPVTASMTSGSANIGVPNASIFEVGSVVFFGVSNTNGFNTKGLGQAYFVVSVDAAGNKIQVSDTFGGTAKTATATNSTQTVGSYGYPGIWLNGWNGGYIKHFSLNNVDLETVSTAGLIAQNAISGRISLRNVPATGTNQGLSHVCARGSAIFIDSTYEGIILDADNQSSVAWSGARRGTPIQHNPGFGIVRDEQYSARIGVNLTEYDKSDFYAFTSLNGDSVFFRTALQFYVQQRGSGETEAVGNGNFVTYNGAGGGSRTLPQITSDSHVGVIFSLTNTASSSITWNTSGSQTFNNKAGSTAMTIGANSSAMVQGQKIGAAYIWAILGTSGTVTF